MVLVTFSFSFGQQSGKASWYGNHHHGRKSADGSIFNEWGMTCASNTYKMGTRLKVTNLENGKAVTVRVTDTGGFTKLGRIIDLSKGAFQKLAPLSRGIIKVLVEKVD